MPRDYKQRPNTRRPPPRRHAQGISRGTSFGIGICVGAILTALIFVHGAKVSVDELAAGIRGGDSVQEEETTFEFYTVLPRKEIVVPTVAVSTSASSARTRDNDKPDVVEGSTQFMLQAASFRKPADADALKARLALLGLEASVQQVRLKDNETWFRVRLGPYRGNKAMEEVKSRLQSQNIQVLTTRLR